MSFFPTPPVYIGMDVNTQNTHVAQLRKSRKGWEVMYLKTYSPNEHLNLLDRGTVVSSLPSRETLVRTCELHVKKEREIKAALAFHLEPQLPYSAEQAVLQFQSIKKKVKGTVLTAFSVRSDHLENHLKHLNEKGIKPEKVVCTPYALAMLTTLFPQTNSPQFLVYEGKEEITCVLVEQGKLLAARAFDHKSNLGTEIQKTILSLSSTHKTKKIESILFIGKRGESIQQATGKKVVFPSIPLLPISQEEIACYGLAIGIALAADKKMDFRQNAFTYARTWTQVKKPLIVCVALSILLIGSLFSFSHSALRQQKQAVKQAYLSLIQEKEISSSLLKTPEDYLLSLSQFEKKVRARPDTFPLLPIIPKVEEVLAWLSTQPSIDIDTFHYTMVKRPSFSHKKERYKIKVNLEFFAKDLDAANAFHNLLLSPCKWIDPKEKVEWIIGKGKYRASFYLKDKTRYN